MILEMHYIKYSKKVFLFCILFIFLFFNFKNAIAVCPEGYELVPVQYRWSEYNYDLNDSFSDVSSYPTQICYKKRPPCATPDTCQTPTNNNMMVVNPCPTETGDLKQNWCPNDTVCCFKEEQEQIVDGQLDISGTNVSSKDQQLASTTIKFKPEVGIPGFLEEKNVSGFLFGDFLTALFRYLIYLSGVFAVIIIIASGFQWVLAGGNKSKIERAKSRLKNSLIGFVLCSSSVLILSTINLDLINIRPLDIKYIIPIPIVEVNRFEMASTPLKSGPGGSHLFSQALIDGIKKHSATSGIDPCVFYAVIHQESGGNVGAFGNDSAVANCQIIARRAHICNLYPSCCPNFISGSTNKSYEACTNCTSYVTNKSISGVSKANWKNYLTKRGYTFGLGLTQITYFSGSSQLCNGNNGFKYQGICVNFDDLFTIDGSLSAFAYAWPKSYCKDGNLLMGFRRYADGSGTSNWGITTGDKKYVRYTKCKDLGFEYIASKGIPK